MACITHTRHILRRDGTNQLERLLDALQPGFVNVDERSREDLMKFISSFAEQVQYYNSSNVRDGDWTDFFNDFNQNYEPHIALMLTFLELFRKSQDHINEITCRHLEFYYKRILQIKERVAEPDRVYLIIELAKEIQQFKLKKETEVKAGKDKTGKELFYKTEKEIVINQAKVSGLKTVFVDRACENRIYAAPMANSADGVSKPLKGDEPKWYTFGRDQSGFSADQKTMIEPEIGFAIASSLLRMNEGTRTVTLTCEFSPDLEVKWKTLPAIVNTDYSQSLTAWFSGEKKWLGPFDVRVTTIKKTRKLELSIVCRPDIPAIVPYTGKLPGSLFNTDLPVLRILINTLKQPYPYHLLKLLKLTSTTLNVSVEGIQNLVLQNEQGPVDASKPFMPFGSFPTVGSKFYIGNDEVFSKKPDSLELFMKWKDLPTNAYGFDRYYHDYEPGKHLTDSFICKVAALQDHIWTNESTQEFLKLFDTEGVLGRDARREAVKKRSTHELHLRRNARISEEGITHPSESINPTGGGTGLVTGFGEGLVTGGGTGLITGFGEGLRVPLYYLYNGEIRRTIAVENLSLHHNSGVQQIKKFDVSSNNGFLRLELSGQDFGHKEYPALLVRKSMELSQDIADNNGTASGAVVLPNAPYTPVLDYITLSYSSTQILNPGKFTPENGACQVFHIEPFGIKEIMNPISKKGIPLLPQFTDEGYLYIGIKNLKPRQNLTLLFRMAESSNLTEPFVARGKIRWCYLSNDEWVAFKTPEILSDSTEGLQTTGIIEFDVPDTATSENRLMPSGLHWIRISVPENATGANQMIDITAQAVTAVFTDRNNDPTHLEEVLSAGSISKLASPNPAVKKIIQPYSSFGGRVAEGNAPFYGPYYTRVSERLRHKGRAITIWDMEHMVLEQFPGIYKVKCLNHSSETTDSAPGHITMVVIENVRNKNAINLLQPKTSAINLYEIGKFLEKYVGPFVAVHVQNPLYEEILVDFKVSFLPGYDAGYYKLQLNEEIKKFLSPWAYTEGEDIMFGNIIYKSSILNFIEEREYVDYVLDFKMYHITKSWGIGCMEVQDDFVVGDSEIVIDDEDQAEAKTSRSILVSAANHTICVCGETGCTCNCEGTKT